MVLKLVTQPKLTLDRLLRRRKTTLKRWLEEIGLTTYPDVLQKCKRLGILPPSEEEFLVAWPTPVTNPTSGVVVLPEIPVINAETGAQFDPEIFAGFDPRPDDLTEPLTAEEAVSSPGDEPTAASPRKYRKRKDES